MARTRVTTKPPEAAKSNVVDIATKRPRPENMWRRLYSAALGLGRRNPIGGSRPRAPRANPFKPAEPLPGVVGSGEKPAVVQIAMDAAEAYQGALDSGEVPGWFGSGAQAYAASAYAEGQEWLGYAVLAILAQRPEYRIATDIYATDMTREWIEFKSKSDDKDKQERIDKLVERLTKLRLKQIIKEAIENDGLQGRGQIYIDTGAADDPDELKTPIGSGGKDTQAKFGRDGMAHDYDPANRAFPEEVDATNAASKPDPEGGEKKGRIKRLSAIEPMWCYPSQYNADDPLKVDWYRPEIWWVMGKEVHRTRLLTFVSNPVPDMLKPAYSFGGLARTQMMKPYVDFWLRNRTSGSDLLSNFSVPVLSTDLEVTTMEEGSELFQRVMTFNVLRDNQSTMVINKDSEEFNIAAAPLGGVKDLVGQSAEHMCLTGDALVETDRGAIPIREVTTSDRVLTREGLSTLVWAGRTGYARELVVITTDEGELRVTPCHPIYLSSTGEFVAAERVRVGDLLLRRESIPTPSLGGATGGIPIRATTDVLASIRCSIRRSGGLIAGLFREVASFITRTRTRSTIGRTISNYSLARSTTYFISWAAGSASRSILLDASHARTVEWSSTARRGWLGSAEIVACTRPRSVVEDYLSLVTATTRRALTVARYFASRWSRSDGSTVARGASRGRGGSVRVLDVRRIKLQRSVPVYNLSVSDDGLPEFFANGVLVHNCLPGRIPIVKFFGDQPSGLNASSEGVIRLWYDNVNALQEALIREPIQTIIDLVQVELWGETDPDIEFDFVPLWQLDQAGASAVQKTKADQRAVDIQAGVISAEEARRAAAHDPDSQYSGLDLNEPLPEPPAEEDPLAGEPTEEETGEEPGGQQHAGARPSRRDVGGLTNRAANFGGAISGGLPTHDIALDALEGMVRDGRVSLGLAMDVLAALDDQKRDDRGRFAEGGEGGDPANYGEGGSFTQLKPHEREHLFKVGEIAHKHGYRNLPTVSEANHAMWERGGKEDRHVLRAYTYMHDDPGKYQPSWHNRGPGGGFTGGGHGHEGLEEHLRELHGEAKDEMGTLDLDDEDFPFGHDMAMDIGKWEEHLHPRAEGGKFAPKGSAAPGHHALLVKHGFEQHPESPHAIYRHKSGHQVAFSQSGMAKGTAYVTGFYKNHQFTHSVSNKKSDLEAALAKLDHSGASTTKPPADIGEVLPDKQVLNGLQSWGGQAVSFTKKGDDGLVKEQAVFGANGKWKIWTKEKGTVATGEGQESFDAEFEKLHPRDANGKFITTGAKTEPGGVTPPKGIEKLLPDKQTIDFGVNSYGGKADVYTKDDPVNPGQLDEQVIFGANGKWKIWTQKEGTVATGNGQESFDKEFEKLHPKDVNGEFIAPGPAAATPSGSPAPVPGSNIGHALDLKNLKQIGPQKGSNPGGTYEANDGEKFYVKLPKTNDHTKNEILAAALFHAAGGETLSYHEVKDGDKIGVGTDLENLAADNVSQLTSKQREEAQNDFALHAWLANWDAVGLTGDNIGVRSKNGLHPVPLDFGGSLLYRAQGSPKGSAFSDEVGEWDTMRDKAGKNKSAADLYGDMTDEQLKQSAFRLKDMTDSKIIDLAAQFGPGSDQDKLNLAVKLIKRRDDILKRAAEPSKPKEPPKPPPDPFNPVADFHKVRETMASWNPKGKPQAAVAAYKDGEYKPMNSMMRYFGLENNPSPYAAKAREIRDWIEKSSTKEDLVLYRGVPGSEYTKEVINLGEVGAPTAEHGFSSVSSSLSFSTSWAGGQGSKGIIYHIKVPKGSKLATVKGVGQDDHEYEALLQAGSYFKIVKKHGNVNGGPYRIDVELVQPHMKEKK